MAQDSDNAVDGVGMNPTRILIDWYNGFQFDVLGTNYCQYAAAYKTMRVVVYRCLKFGAFSLN